MLGIDAVMGNLTVPMWVAGAASAVFLTAIVLAISRAGAAAFINTLLRVALVIIAVSAGWFYVQRTEQQERAAERRSLDERSAALLARSVSPGSALSCLDELAGEVVETACEKAVFASPEAVAAAVSYITAKLALLADGSERARVDAAFAAELVPLRAALELDRFGIVAHVLASRNGCTADKCDALAQFSDYSHVRVNLRDHTFDEQVTKFAANWNARGAVPDGTAALATTAALPQNPNQGPVSPRFDFPSSQSIPPVNIMVPESPAPRVGAAPAGTVPESPAPRVGTTPAGQPAAAPADGNSRANVTPVPPRRPPTQARPPAATAASRPSGSQPSVPLAVGETPTDGAVSRPSGATPAR
jgi:hypothetical protein